MIEMCLILPIIILMLLGCLDLGLALQQNIVVADSARAGAEYAMGSASRAADLTGMQNAATASAGNIPGYHAVAASYCTCAPGGSTVSCTSSCSGGTVPVQYAQVTATASIPLPFTVQALPASVSMKSVALVRTVWTAGN